MRHDHKTIQVADASIYMQSWTVTSPCARVLIVHGLGEHSSRYAWTAHQYNAAGMDVYTYDQRGHGKSSGRRAYIHSFDRLVEDFEAVQVEVPADDDLPLFVYAHSMGALMMAKYLIDRRPTHIRGIVCSGGAFKVDPELSPLLQKLAPIIGRILPRLKTVKLDPNLVSRDSDEVAAYANDPLVNHAGTYALTGWQMLQTIEYVRARAQQWSLPTLLLHGGADKLIDPAGSIYMHDHITADDKEVEIMDGLYHEIMREPEKELVLERMTRWITARL